MGAEEFLTTDPTGGAVGFAIMATAAAELILAQDVNRAQMGKDSPARHPEDGHRRDIEQTSEVSRAALIGDHQICECRQGKELAVRDTGHPEGNILGVALLGL